MQEWPRLDYMVQFFCKVQFNCAMGILWSKNFSTFQVVVFQCLYAPHLIVFWVFFAVEGFALAAMTFYLDISLNFSLKIDPVSSRLIGMEYEIGTSTLPR